MDAAYDPVDHSSGTYAWTTFILMVLQNVAAPAAGLGVVSVVVNLVF